MPNISCLKYDRSKCVNLFMKIKLYVLKVSNDMPDIFKLKKNIIYHPAMLNDLLDTLIDILCCIYFIIKTIILH